MRLINNTDSHRCTNDLILLHKLLMSYSLMHKLKYDIVAYDCTNTHILDHVHFVEQCNDLLFSLIFINWTK